jgi:ankyrin repeat protein
VLLAHGADASAHNNLGRTPLHYASRWWNRNHHELAESLLAHGADVHAMDNSGETPLHRASDVPQDRGLFMVNFLLENGVDFNAISNDGTSPLQRAISWNNQGLTAMLLTYGADVRVLKIRGRERANVSELPVDSRANEHRARCFVTSIRDC